MNLEEEVKIDQIQSKTSEFDEQSSYYYDEEDDKSQKNGSTFGQNDLKNALDKAQYVQKSEEEYESEWEESEEEVEAPIQQTIQKNDVQKQNEDDSSSDDSSSQEEIKVLNQQDSIQIIENPYIDVKIQKDYKKKKIITALDKNLIDSKNQFQIQQPRLLRQKKTRQKNEKNNSVANSQISSVSSISSNHSVSSQKFQQKLMKEGMINEEIILFENKKQEMQLQLDHLKFEKSMINMMHTNNQLVASRVINEDKINMDIQDAVQKQRD